MPTLAASSIHHKMETSHLDNVYFLLTVGKVSSSRDQETKGEYLISRLKALSLLLVVAGLCRMG
jgi:hypothetical protein